jgi:hypothetical protein
MVVYIAVGSGCVVHVRKGGWFGTGAVGSDAAGSRVVRAMRVE